MDKNSLTQYIELYGDCLSEYEGNELEKKSRRRTMDILHHAGKLPERGDEGFKAFSISEIFAPDLGINLNRMKLGRLSENDFDSLARFRCGVPNISTLLIYVLNDIVVIPEKTLASLPESIEISRLSYEKGMLNPGDISSGDGDVTAALNTLLFKDGIRIRISGKVQENKPIQIVNLADSSIQALNFRRVLIDVEENASCKILFCDHTEKGSVPSVSHQVIETRIQPGASLEIYNIEETDQKERAVWQLFSSLERDSRLKINICSLKGGKTRYGLHTELLGKGADFYAGGMAIVDGDSVVDINSSVIHRGTHCRSEQLFKFVLDGNSRGAFEGLVTVVPGAIKTNAAQSDRNLVLSPDAKMHTEPQLLINCDDVKCSHGASTGQIDERALFYLRSRGIPRKEAENMLVRSFMVDVIDTIGFEPLRDRIQHLVEMRLSDQENNTDKCISCRATNN